MLARALGLPPPLKGEVTVERDLAVTAPEGAVLLADRWYAPGRPGPEPVVLIRTPYGRRQLSFYGRLFAERGYQVVIQSCRGTFGSGGATFDPFRQEPEDGRVTLEWIAAQPWFGGSVGMFGASYMGLAQWAVASDPPPYLGAMAMQVTTARVRDIVYPGGTFALETGAVWVNQMQIQEKAPLRMLLALTTGRRRLMRAFATLPLTDADTAALGVEVPFYRDWLAHGDLDDPWWEPLDWSQETAAVPPVSTMAGWYDLFLPGQLEDARRLREAGRQVRLTIGPWTHTSPRAGVAAIRDGLEWFDAHLGQRRGRPGEGRRPVRYFVMGARRWEEADGWPPPHEPRRWYLAAGGSLSDRVPLAGGGPDRFSYDPADPAPGRGGPSLDPIRSGRRDQRRRESRSDVLTYSSDPLERPLVVTGPVSAEVWCRCSRQWFDVFVRLCDVDSSGRSRNVCDGIIRVGPDLGPDQPPAGPDGTAAVTVALWPTAHEFRVGHRVRVQVSTAAHPLYARNLGGGEPLASGVTLHAGEMEIFHDEEHPSAVILPVAGGGG